ncbi:type II toxin-antitoxin system RelE/ParE family toxin [Agrobacterium sp. DKPNP3]|uniref:type II toxin-antitoxin system RelE/ParE family toxin n=1 Tax=unclassified Agrobacterium TaxID=2632611 RepID=UPI0015FB8933|nr:type II toxin-antitoxin system RelE/ParE family toxin [Agrobacterium sp. RC10-4-1]MBA8801505.1 proteic killer suppression protein [Agrobacterium sp. RC10-4-1]
MIKTFKHKALSEFFATGKTAKIDQKMLSRIKVRLDRLEQATTVGEMKLPGFDFHPLNGFNPTKYTVHVNGPWCITFEFDNGDAYNVDFEQYH